MKKSMKIFHVGYCCYIQKEINLYIIILEEY